MAQKVKGPNFSGRGELKIKIKNYYTQTFFFRWSPRISFSNYGDKVFGYRKCGVGQYKQRPKATLGQIILKPSLKKLRSKGKNPANEKHEKNVTRAQLI